MFRIYFAILVFIFIFFSSCISTNSNKFFEKYFTPSINDIKIQVTENNKIAIEISLNDYLYEINRISKVALSVNEKKLSVTIKNKASEILSEEFDTGKNENLLVEGQIETLLGKNNPITFKKEIVVSQKLKEISKIAEQRETEKFKLTELQQKRKQIEQELSILIEKKKQKKEAISAKQKQSMDIYYKKSIGVIIGINNYLHWPNLEYAVNDANEIEKILSKMNFGTIIKILNKEATRRKILTILSHQIPKMADSNDRIVIYFAGHGQTEELSSGGEEGYIIPFDSELENYFTTAISMTQIRSLTSRISSKHILFIMDSCYSGLGINRGIRRLSSQGISAEYYSKISSKRSVQIITAGGKDEQVKEKNGHGLFTAYLIRALNGAADYNGDCIITSLELGTYLKPTVSNASLQNQTPQYGILEGEGEILFNSKKCIP